MSTIDHTPAAAGVNAAIASSPTAGSDAQIAASSGSRPTGPALDSDLRAVWDKHHPARNEDGTFAPRPADSPEQKVESGDAAAHRGGAHNPAERPTTAKPETSAADSPPVDRAADGAAVEAPQFWSAEQKARWGSVPPDVQAYVVEREAGVHQALTRAGEQLRTLQQQFDADAPLRQLIEAHRESFAQRGVAPTQGIAALLEAQRRLDQDPVAGLTQIARHYDFDLGPFFQAHKKESKASPAVQPDPAISRLAADVRSLTGQVRAQQGVLDAQRKAEHDARVAALQREVEALQDKPHFDDLRPLMTVLMTQGQAGTIAEAYDMAVNANRQSIQQEERAQEEAKRQAGEQARAEQARRAAMVNVGKGQPASHVKPKTMDDTLTEIARRRYG